MTTSPRHREALGSISCDGNARGGGAAPGDGSAVMVLNSAPRSGSRRRAHGGHQQHDARRPPGHLRARFQVNISPFIFCPPPTFPLLAHAEVVETASLTRLRTACSTDEPLPLVRHLTCRCRDAVVELQWYAGARRRHGWSRWTALQSTSMAPSIRAAQAAGIGPRWPWRPPFYGTFASGGSLTMSEARLALQDGLVGAALRLPRPPSESTYHMDGPACAAEPVRPP